MREVLVVDDDFMVAEIHRRFVDTSTDSAPSGWPAPAPRRSPRRSELTART